MVLAQLDPTGIFDLGNTSLIFWTVVTFLILLFLGRVNSAIGCRTLLICGAR